MPRKSAPVFVCRSCGGQTPKWMGRCPECGEWDALAEFHVPSAGRASGSAPPEVRSLHEVSSLASKRVLTGIAEMDRVLGGGFVPGSSVLIGGDPGIGKSTLLLQACDGAAKRGLRCLYVTGEESLEQVRLRADRLGVDTAAIRALSAVELPAVLGAIEAEAPELVVVDSIQTLSHPDVPSAAGGVSQIRAAADALTSAAKRSGAALVLIGHVTKDGTLAGPKVLEHLVDAVLSFEGDRYQGARILRAAKNRFGSVSEVGVFEIGEAGLRGVEDASAYFLAESPAVAAEGSVVFPAAEGSRVLLVEIQSLTGRSSQSFPLRRTSGVDPERLPMILAVLEARAKLPASAHDVFVNVVGGIRLDEPAADLAVALAIASSLTGRPVPRGLAAFGEVGLRGEVRRVTGAAERARTLERIGVRSLVAPTGNETEVRKECARMACFPVPDVSSSLLILEGSHGE